MKNAKRRMVRGRLSAITLIITVILSVTATVQAQTYPNRDITFIVPFAPGGSSDPVGRSFAKLLEKLLGGNINVENRPGGSATIGVGMVVRAKPDGYTIGLGSNSSLCYQPLVNKGLPYRTPNDYQPIVKLVEQHAILTVRADAPWKTFEEFMADVRKNPGKIRVSVSAIRGLVDLVVQQLNQVAGVKITTVPFTGGGGEGMIALLGGRVEANAGHAATALGHVQAGKIRVLTAFQKTRNEVFPEVPSVVEAGYDATLASIYALIAPKGIPRDVLDKLVAASLQVVRKEDYIKFCRINGFEVQAKGPEELRTELIQHTKIFTDLIKILDKKLE